MFRYLNFHSFSMNFFPEQVNYSLAHESYGVLVDQVTLMLKDKNTNEHISLSSYDTIETDSETTKPAHSRGKDNQTFYTKYTDSKETLPPIEIQICLGKDEIELRVVSNSVAYDCFEWQGVVRFGKNQEEDILAILRQPMKGIMNLTVGPAVPPGADALFNRKNDTQLCFSNEAGLYYDYTIEAYRFAMSSKTGTIRLWLEKEIVSRSMGVHYKPMRTPLDGIIPCGFMTWYALMWRTCEKTVIANIEAQAKLLKKYGANTIWIDFEWYHNNRDCPGNCDTLNPDPEVYPRGLKYIADIVRENGMIPAIWCSPTHDVNENEYLIKYPDMLLIKQKEWCGQYFFDPTNPHFINDFIPAVFNNVKNWGYRAVKWDTLPRSLDLYDDYHDRFYDPSVTSETALRNVLAKTREVLGEDYYLLSCSGENDRVVTACSEMFDAARIGSDIFEWKEFIRYGVARMMKFYPMHNTMLLCDPDNLVLREEYNSIDQAISRASLYAMMGAPINIGDDLTQLSEKRLAIYKKILPAIRIRPTELKEKELNTDVLVLNNCIQNQWESYHVVDVFNTTEHEIQYTLSLNQIGKQPEERVLVYDFWNESFLGICNNELSLTLLPYASTVLSIRTYESRPQLVSVSRHILQGAYEITNMKWENETLSGEVDVVANSECKLRFYIPNEYTLKTTNNMSVIQEDRLIDLTINQPESGIVKWLLEF